MLIYVCTPKEETKNPAQTKFICYLIAKHGHVPIAPRLYFPQFIHHGEEALIEQLISISDEMWVIGSTTDAMKDEMEMALREHIPIQHFLTIDVMANLLENDVVPTTADSADQQDNASEELEKEAPPLTGKADDGEAHPRSFDELMGELVKINCAEEAEGIIEFAYAKARALEPRTHMDRGIVEKLIYVYNSMVNDMEKIEMTDEEKQILLREGLNSIAEQLHIDSRLAAAVLLMAEEEAKDDSIVEVITEYCAERVPSIAKAIGLPQSLVDKVVFISNIWRWRDRKEIEAGSFITWWPKHLKDLANLLGQSESVIKQILDAELASQ